MRSVATLIALTVLLLLAAFALSQARAADKPKADGGPSKTKIEHVDAEGAAKLIADKKAVVLDIRTPDEFKAGHIAGAKLIDFRAADFEKKLGELDKVKTYLVHCGSGGRSTRALETFKKLGFQSVVHFDGGFKAWEKAGQPVEK
jgi:rhodanese-related sulfurtransferase